MAADATFGLYLQINIRARRRGRYSPSRPSNKAPADENGPIIARLSRVPPYVKLILACFPCLVVITGLALLVRPLF